jgi:hypothetical protein
MRHEPESHADAEKRNTNGELLNQERAEGAVI